MAAPKFNIPTGNNKMANRFIGIRASKTVKFLDLELEISKLTINQVLAVQKITKEAEANKEDTNGINILSAVIRSGAKELSDLSQEDLQDFPMEALAELSNQIMEFSGLLPKKA